MLRHFLPLFSDASSVTAALLVLLLSSSECCRCRVRASEEPWLSSNEVLQGAEALDRAFDAVRRLTGMKNVIQREVNGKSAKSLFA